MSIEEAIKFGKIKLLAPRSLINTANLTGDFSDLWGDASDLRGDCTGLIGDCTGLRGECSEIVSALKKGLA